jgi:uncharacterized protein (DUF3084 family)
MSRYFLAQVFDKSRYGSKGKVRLIGARREDGIWTAANTSETLPLNNSYPHLNEGMLVLLELDNKRQILKVVSAAEELLSYLRDWSLRLAKFESEEAEIKSWRESLKYQGTEFFIRNEELQRREQAIEAKEAQLNKLLEATEEQKAALERERQVIKIAMGENQIS